MRWLLHTSLHSAVFLLSTWAFASERGLAAHSKLVRLLLVRATYLNGGPFFLMLAKALIFFSGLVWLLIFSAELTCTLNSLSLSLSLFLSQPRFSARLTQMGQRGYFSPPKRNREKEKKGRKTTSFFACSSLIFLQTNV